MRSSYGGGHRLGDTVRGATKQLISASTAVEGTLSSGFVSFDSDGFTIGNNAEYNKLDETLVAWTWKAGGNKNTFNVDDVGYATAAAAGLTAGDTTIAGASVGTKQGFSIIKYTGPNDTSAHEVAHGLSQAPDFIITKNLDATYNWDIYHSALGDNEYLIFTTAGTDSGRFSGRPTSTVFKTAHDYSTNENQDYIAYCWHNVPGLQKFGSYTGNNSSDGPFVELGFRPAVIIIKDTGAGQEWVIIDTERGSYNPIDNILQINLNDQEYTNSSYNVDALSNGFKVRGTNGRFNSNNQTYVYMAWAEAPSVDLYGGGANAR
jgi:hypothetical protein